MSAKPIINYLDECIAEADGDGSSHVIFALLREEVALVRAALRLAKSYHDKNWAARAGYDVLALQCEEESNMALSEWREAQEKLK